MKNFYVAAEFIRWRGGQTANGKAEMGVWICTERYGYLRRVCQYDLRESTYISQTGVLCQNDDLNGSKVCFLINFSDKELKCTVKFPAFTSCREILSDAAVTENKLELEFAPYETKIFDCRI